MAATILIQDDTFELLADERALGPPRVLDAEARDRLEALSARYGLLERHPDPATMIDIGRDFYRWLDGDHRQLHRLLEDATPPLILTIHCPRRDPSGGDWALLQAPWELLADERGYLAADRLLDYSPQRRLGPLGTPPAPDAYRLGLAFMAAAPEGAATLDYEAEEAAILKAVGGTKLDLLVDESGEAAELGRRLGELGASGGLPVLHLSCHGDSAWRDGPDRDPRPVLLLEDGAFGIRPTDAPALLHALHPARPRLLFLSACRSTALPSGPGQGSHGGTRLPPAPNTKQANKQASRQSDPPPDPGPGIPPAPAHSLASALIRAGLPAVIGWDGTVADAAATRFAAALYQGLAAYRPLALAVAAARYELLQDPQERLRADWHLARLWLGSGGDGDRPLVVGRRKRSLFPANHIPPTFLGKDVPVAAHERFVGRRRELQRALRILDQGHQAGLMLTGLGRLGKSSLAARIANRRRDHWTLVVLHGRFGYGDLLERLKEALQDHPAARDFLQERQTRVRDAAQHGQEGLLIPLGDLLTDLLRGPCQQQDAQGPALLLVLDDFEQLLETASEARPVVAAPHAGLIATILRAFDPNASDSRLLITSRFPFRLAANGQDLARKLARIQLASFGDTDQRKLILRQQEAARELPDAHAREALLPRARDAARGNPGLLELLIARLLLNPAVPLGNAQAALEEMEGYPAGDGPPGNEELRGLLENIAINTLLELAGAAGRDLLRAMTLFRLPIPRPVGDRLAAGIGGQIQDLLDLALLEPGQDPVPSGPRPQSRPGPEAGPAAVRIGPLAAGQLSPLQAGERASHAAAVVGHLFQAWGGETGERPAAADLQLAELALASKETAAAAPIAAACGAAAIRALGTDGYDRAAALGKDLLRLLQDAEYPIPWRLYADAARTIAATGDGATADDLLARGIAALETTEDVADMGALHLFNEYADRLHRRGELDEALRIRTQEQLPICKRLGDVREKAITQGRIADILQDRGELDEALRIRIQEELPVYERLGDVREKAITQSKIADILQDRGELDEALRILRDEVLDAFERLGDVRHKAVTQGKIADILQARGQLDEALRIRIQEELPVYERLGDVREKAITQGKIADIQYRRGELDEALRIRTQEQLPVYERLGDVRSQAVTQGQIADIRYGRGELDEALRILRDEVLDAFERLGDVRHKAVTQGKIADILQARGELDEALRIRIQEQLPVYERLGDVHQKAVTQGQIADIRYRRGELDEALRIRIQEELPVYERLGDVRSQAITQGKIADILMDRGELDEALRILRDEVLDVFERLGDVRSQAVTQGRIADIRYRRGELDEALRIRIQEQLPVFERLGDVHSQAVAQGQIADILQTRGELDEALRILRDEVLDVFERLGDVRGVLVCRANIARILLARDGTDEREQANALLCLALTDARRLRIPEAQRIQAILERHAMTCP